LSHISWAPGLGSRQTVSSLFEFHKRTRVHEHVFVADREQFGVVLTPFLPDKLGNEVLLAKDLVHHEAEVEHLMIVDADEDEPLLAQNLTGNKETRVDVCEPS